MVFECFPDLPLTNPKAQARNVINAGWDIIGSVNSSTFESAPNVSLNLRLSAYSGRSTLKNYTTVVIFFIIITPIQQLSFPIATFLILYYNSYHSPLQAVIIRHYNTIILHYKLLFFITGS